MPFGGCREGCWEGLGMRMPGGIKDQDPFFRIPGGIWDWDAFLGMQGGIRDRDAFLKMPGGIRDEDAGRDAFFGCLSRGTHFT
eukprot:scaffold110129_cov14-Tisochrysis_lutea.AAC.1